MSERDEARVLDALTLAYKELLRQPLDAPFRIGHQGLYANLSDAIADLIGRSHEETQTHFEHLVATEVQSRE